MSHFPFDPAGGDSEEAKRRAAVDLAKRLNKELPQTTRGPLLIGGGIAIPQGAASGYVLGSDANGVAAWQATATPAAHAATHVTGGGDTIADAVASGNSGLMSGADKAKLDAIAEGATAYTDALAVAAVQTAYDNGTADLDPRTLPAFLATSRHDRFMAKLKPKGIFTKRRIT